MRNITVRLFGESGKENITFIHSYEVIIGCSCDGSNQCSPYKATLPKGSYVIDCYGASGTDIYNNFSMGAHTSGSIHLNHKQDVYIYVGQQGSFNGSATFNGGGKGNIYSWAGGGATDIRLKYGSFDLFDSLKTRIIFSGGGGGHSNYSQNFYEGGKGNAGGLIGENGGSYIGNYGYYITLAEGGTQTNGGIGGNSTNPKNEDIYEPSPIRNGKFGIGGSNFYGSGGGGGGYFGGGAGHTDFDQVGFGAGGSSYISGHPGCHSISEDASEENLITEDTPYHYSNLIFTDTYMSTWDSDDRNLGNGYVKILFFIDPIPQTCSHSFSHIQFTILVIIVFLCHIK